MHNDSDLVLLTGISGFVAKHLAVELLNLGYRVRGTVRSHAKGEEVRETLAAQGAEPSRLEIVETDLESDDGWDAAMAGVRFVQHTASPFPGAQPKDKLSLVPVARGGTLRVVEAAKRAGVERIVLTSSVAAVCYGHEARLDPTFSEADVSNVDSPSITPYAVSKTLAELAAWDAVSGSATTLATINPSLVLGPLLDAHPGTSVMLMRMMMKGRMPVVPDISIGIVDVRDVAAAHCAAMILPAAAGRRFIVSGGSRSLREIGTIVGEAFPEFKSRMPKATLPDVVVRAAAVFSSHAASAAAELGRRKTLVTEPAETILGIRFRTPEQALAATVERLVARRLV